MSGLRSYPRFVSIEGGEGAGKSTVIGALEAALRARGERVVTTREPGGTPLAEHLRELLLDPAHEAARPETELLLMFAARAQHAHETIRPALASGAWVLCDRFTDSSYAYQGAGRGIDTGLITTLERAVVGIEPGLTLLLDLDTEAGRVRALSRGGAPDRIEREHDAFFARVRQGFLARAKENPARFRVLDAGQPADVVAAAARAALEAHRP
ncbi:dTMP kinase [Lysobacter pythonis]|uniref:Thymidylate kinase n=1 Tax=Solilutibacter pythonis TaxID=2483112 RepID=A0A3M2HM97_9GAMM|nr:dTMP kinase [Lysobacter pythonis]RMH90841.1 dTMP kinase [Lysobacter pythonis]